MDIKNCKPGHIFKDCVTLTVTEVILSKSRSMCKGYISLFGILTGKDWTMDIPSDQEVNIGSVLKLGSVAELTRVHMFSSGNIYSLAIVLSKDDFVCVEFTDGDFNSIKPTNKLAQFKVGDIAMTTKHHGGTFPFGIGPDTLVDIIDIDEVRGYTIKTRTLGITVRGIGWVI